MMTVPWLTVLALLPLVGAAALIVVKGRAAKPLALVVSLLDLASSRWSLLVVLPARCRHAVRRAGRLDQAARASTTRSAWTASG